MKFCSYKVLLLYLEVYGRFLRRRYSQNIKRSGSSSGDMNTSIRFETSNLQNSILGDTAVLTPHFWAQGIYFGFYDIPTTILLFWFIT
jgi:hypothetical protein